MNILWLGKRFYTNKDALRERFGRMYRLPMHWHESGQHVQLWLVDYHTRESISMSDAGMAVVSAPIFGFATLRQILRTITIRRPNCIVASGDCYLGLLGWVLARLSGARFVLDVYDKYDDFSGYRRFGGFEPLTFLLEHADGLMFASRALAESLCSGLLKPCHVAPNGIDPEQFKPRDMLECRRECGLPSDVILVGYVGSMESDRGVTDLIDAMIHVRAAGIPAELLLAGKVEQGLVPDHAWIRYLGMVPHAKVAALLNACDVVVVPYRIGPFMDMGASCKIAEYLACLRPLVATETRNFSANFAAQAALMGQALCRASDPVDLARALRYQLKTHMVLPATNEMSWGSIAAGALNWLKETCGCGMTDASGKGVR